MSASTPRDPGLPLLAGHASLDEPLAWRAGQPLAPRRFLQDVQGLAPLLRSVDAAYAAANCSPFF